MKRRNEVLVGILLVLGLALGIFGTVWLTRGSLRKGYVLYAVFSWGAGLRQGQPVSIAGVTVGYVDEVELRQNGTLFVTMRVHHEYKVPAGSKAAVQAVGFFGDQQIALIPEKPNDISLMEGDTVPPMPLGATIADQLARVDTISRSMMGIIRALDTELVQAGALKDMRATMANLNRLSAQVSTIAAEQSTQLTATMTSVRRTLGSIDSVKVDSIVGNFRQASANIVALSNELKSTVGDVQALIAKYQNPQGSLYKIANDPALYDQLHSILARSDALAVRIDSILVDFQRNPRKYLKFSIF